MLTTLVAALLAAAPRPQPAVAPASRDVVTSEGIRFRLPPGLSYHVAEEEGRRSHVALSEDRATAVLVKAYASDAPMPCEATEGEARVVTFRTGRGLGGCAVSAEAEGRAVVMIFVKAGEAIVAITAVAPDDAAGELAASVAESVTISPGAARKLPRHDVPRTDARMLACFEREGSVPRLLLAWQRCFAEDFTFTQKHVVGMSTRFVNLYGEDVGTKTTLSRGERSGAWTVADGMLRLVYEDGEELELAIELDGDDLVLDGQRWRRL